MQETKPQCVCVFVCVTVILRIFPLEVSNMLLSQMHVSSVTEEVTLSHIIVIIFCYLPV